MLDLTHNIFQAVRFYNDFSLSKYQFNVFSVAHIFLSFFILAKIRSQKWDWNLGWTTRDELPSCPVRKSSGYMLAYFRSEMRKTLEQNSACFVTTYKSAESCWNFLLRRRNGIGFIFRWKPCANFHIYDFPTVFRVRIATWTRPFLREICLTCVYCRVLVGFQRERKKKWFRRNCRTTKELSENVAKRLTSRKHWQTDSWVSIINRNTYI